MTKTLETWPERLEKDISDLLFICTSQENFSFLLTIQYLGADPAKHTILVACWGQGKCNFEKSLGSVLELARWFWNTWPGFQYWCAYPLLGKQQCAALLQKACGRSRQGCRLLPSGKQNRLARAPHKRYPPEWVSAPSPLPHRSAVRGSLGVEAGGWLAFPVLAAVESLCRQRRKSWHLVARVLF